MSVPPVLILAFNRPDHTKRLISSLSPFAPSEIVFAVDGPRSNHSNDLQNVLRTQESVDAINWPCNVKTIFRQQNLGLRHAVVDAVSETISTYGRAIVLEDDVEVGPNFLGYMTAMLTDFQDDERVAHVNGYNVVPPSHLNNPNHQSRLTKYIESFAWATWERAWKNYDPFITDDPERIISNLTHQLGSLGSNKWKINFSDARNERINTWAYRWMASIWKQNQLVLSPNQNLVRYTGNDVGTHVVRRPKWTELPVTDSLNSLDKSIVEFDELADQWIGQTVFGESLFGIVEGIAHSTILELRQRFRIS